jgi:hypothetical protein
MVEGEGKGEASSSRLANRRVTSSCAAVVVRDSLMPAALVGRGLNKAELVGGEAEVESSALNLSASRRASSRGW